MEKKEIIDNVVEYLNSVSWKKAVDLYRDPEVRHTHHYVNSTLSLESIRDVTCAYLEREFGPVLDVIDLISAYVDGPGVVHTITPTNTPSGHHMDIFAEYVSNIVLTPAPPKGRGRTIIAWREKDHLDLVENYAWRSIGPEEEKEIKRYFTESEQWKVSCEQAAKPDWIHFHINIETSINPFDLEKYLKKEFRKMGWNVHHIVHTIFDTPMRGTTGKIVSILLKPRKVFDIAWINNPDVVLMPCTKPLSQHETPTSPWWDIQFQGAYERYLAGKKFITLSKDDIKAILKRC